MISYKEHIEKIAGGYEVKSEHGNKNLGKTTSLSAAKKRLKQVEYFKHMKEEVSGAEKHHAIVFGRMNPVTTGHEAVVNKLHAVAKEHNAGHSLVVSHSQDAKKNPLSAGQKVKHAKNAFPDTNISSSSKEKPTILHHAAELHKQGVTHLHVVAGSDRHKDMHDLLHKYNGKDEKHGHYNFKKITVHSSGERDPDSEGTEGMSASKMREHAASGNKAEFHRGAPSKMKPEHKDAMYNDVRKGMNIKESLEEAHKIGDKVVIHKGPKDVVGKVGHVGEIRKRYAGDTKTYTIDHDAGSIQLKPSHFKAVKEETTPYWKKSSFNKRMSKMAKQERLERERKEAEKKPVKEETLDQQDDRAKQLKRFKDQMTKGNGPKIDTEIALDKKEKSAMGVKEHLDAKAGAGAWINDFISSTNPRFNNKSKEERRKMAIGAYMAAKAKGVKEEVELEEGTFKYHMDKAVSAHMKGDSKKALYHLDNAKTARYAMPTKDYAKNKDLLNKYKEMSEEVQIDELKHSTVSNYMRKAKGLEESEQLDEAHKFINVATSKKVISDSERVLKDNPNMMYGSKAGYKALITIHKKHLEKAGIKEDLDEEVQIDELSTDLLGKYKTAAHASAKASDEAGNYAKGDKRFSGINKATRKQFDNDLKKHGQYVKEGRGLAAKYWSIAQDRKETAYENRGNHETYHTHMADHHDHMSRYHEELGQHSHAQAHADKADIHHEKSMQKPKAVKESAMNDVPNSDRTDRKGSAYNPFRKEKNASDIARINAAKEREKKSSGLYKKQSPSQRKQTVGELMKLVTHIGEGTMQDNGTDKIDTQTSAPTSSTSKNETPGKKVKGFKFFSGENQPNTQMTVKETATGNPHQGYHGAQQSADDKYEATHKHVKNLTDGDDKTVKHYLDSSHGRHLAGREDDHEYIKKDFKKFKKYYRPEMHEETLKPGSKVQNIDKKTAVIKLHPNGAASDTDEGWAKPKIKEGTMKSYMEFLQSLEEASKKKPEWLVDAEKNAEKKEGKLKEAKEGSAEDKKQDKAGMKRTGMTAKEWEKSAEDKKEDMQEANWIKGAIKHPGAMTAAAKRAGETNSEYEQQHKHDSGKAGRRARLALTLKKMHEEKLDEANHRDLACGGCMHPDMAKHMTVGQHADYYEKGTGDKVHGKVMHKSDTEVHMKQTQDSYDDKKVGTVHKFKIKHSLDEAQINEYESDKSGVYRHTKKATYGTSYTDPAGADETAADMKKKEKAGRKTGQSTGSYKPRKTMSKLKQLGATYK